MPLYTTFDAVGAKEDISTIISNISPTKTPMQTSIGNEKVTQKLYQWQEDVLRAVIDNNQAEGFEASDVSIVPTTMRDNTVQILSETIKVATSQDATDSYGRAKESAYQIAKSMAQVKRDLENAFVGTAQAKVKPTNNLTNRKMAGFQAQIPNAGAGSLALTDMALYTGATTTKPTESNLLDVLQQVFLNGAEPSVIQVTPTNSRTLADFAKASGRYRTFENTAARGEGQRTIINVVDLYVSPFGEQRMLLNRFLKTGNTLVYEPDMWKKVTFRPWTRETLAKTGDNVKIMLVGEFSLKHKNFGASGVIVEQAGPTGF